MDNSTGISEKTKNALLSLIQGPDGESWKRKHATKGWTSDSDDGTCKALVCYCLRMRSLIAFSHRNFAPLLSCLDLQSVTGMESSALGEKYMS
jgi:hypothetical protein